APCILEELGIRPRARLRLWRESDQRAALTAVPSRLDEYVSGGQVQDLLVGAGRHSGSREGHVSPPPQVRTRPVPLLRLPGSIARNRATSRPRRNRGSRRVPGTSALPASGVRCRRTEWPGSAFPAAPCCRRPG